MQANPATVSLQPARQQSNHAAEYHPTRPSNRPKLRRHNHQPATGNPTNAVVRPGVNEQNHDLADLTIKKLMEEQKSLLTDSFVKAATWIHNTSINKLHFSPLQLVTGKAVTIPSLTTGNVASESMSDSEDVQRTIENLTRVISEF